MYSNLSAIVLSLENPDKSGQYSRIIGYQRGAFTSAHMYHKHICTIAQTIPFFKILSHHLTLPLSCFFLVAHIAENQPLSISHDCALRLFWAKASLTMYWCRTSDITTISTAINQSLTTWIGLRFEPITPLNTGLEAYILYSNCMLVRMSASMLLLKVRLCLVRIQN